MEQEGGELVETGVVGGRWGSGLVWREKGE